MDFTDIKNRLQVKFNVNDTVQYDPLDETVYSWEMPKSGTKGVVTELTWHFGFMQEFGVKLELIKFKTANGKEYHCYMDDLILLDHD